jgi:hypothetical protein
MAYNLTPLVIAGQVVRFVDDDQIRRLQLIQSPYNGLHTAYGNTMAALVPAWQYNVMLNAPTAYRTA